MPTLLQHFGVDIPDAVQGVALQDTIRNSSPVRDTALFGMFGRHVNMVTERYVYLRAPNAANSPLYEYTLMPTHMRAFFSGEELAGVELADPFSFTRGLKTMCTPVRQVMNVNGEFAEEANCSFVFDLLADPGQRCRIEDAELEALLAARMAELMKASDAPREQYERMGLAY